MPAPSTPRPMPTAAASATPSMPRPTPSTTAIPTPTLSTAAADIITPPALVSATTLDTPLPNSLVPRQPHASPVHCERMVGTLYAQLGGGCRLVHIVDTLLTDSWRWDHERQRVSVPRTRHGQVARDGAGMRRRFPSCRVTRYAPLSLTHCHGSGKPVTVRVLVGTGTGRHLPKSRRHTPISQWPQ
jgi:hypothetical protein